MSSTSLRSSAKRPRLSAESAQAIGWSCPACTFLNPHSAFKCQICDNRKGTSTRISSTVDNGAMELQRSIQEQIDRTKRQGRRSDSAAGHSDSHSNSRKQLNNIKTEEDSIDESWRLLGESSSSSTSSSSSDSAASSDSSAGHHDDFKLNNRRNRLQKRLSPTPSPSPQPPPPYQSKPTSSSSITTVSSTSKNGANKGKTNGTSIKKEENTEKEHVPASSASSCCSASVVSANGSGKNGKKPANNNNNGGKNGKITSTQSSKSNNRVGNNSSKLAKFLFPRLQNINRQSARETSVTVRGVTVVITDYDAVS